MIFGFICGTSTMQRISTEMFDTIYKNQKWWHTAKQNFFRFFGIIVTLLAMVVSFSILMNGNGISSPCKSCKVISCVPFPPWAPQDDKWWYCDDCGGISADATINPQTKLVDQISINCPYGDVYTLGLENDEGQGVENDKEWLEKQLPKWCRANCDGV